MFFKRSKRPRYADNPHRGITIEGYHLLREATAAMKADRHEEVLAKVREMLETNPHDSVTHTIVATMLKTIGRDTEAKIEMGLAIALDPDNPIPYHRLGLWLRNEGQDSIAEKVLENGWQCYSKRLRRFRPRLTEQDRLKFMGHKQETV